jgi:hypothetical protein
MRRQSFFGRGVAAIVLTRVAWPLVLLGESWVAGAFETGIAGSSEIIGVGSVLSVLGTLLTIPAAALIGLFVEWPKSRRLLKRRSGGWWASLLISVISTFIFVLVVEFGHTLALLTSGLALGLSALIGISGGVCSAVFWWLLAIAPIRRKIQLQEVENSALN